MRYTLIGVVLIVIVAGVVLAPALWPRHHLPHRIGASMSNLKQIGIGLHGYADECGSFPPDLVTLDIYWDGLGSILVSPRDAFREDFRSLNEWQKTDRVVSADDLESVFSYVVLRWGEETRDRADTPLAYEKLARGEANAIILFDDTSVRLLNRDDAVQLIRNAGHEPVWADEP